VAAFKGFGERVIEFFEGLEADNSKAYWTDNKSVYESDVRAPMEALLAHLEPEFGAGSIFRPYRDVRFSKDKSPYKTSCAASAPGGYLQVSRDGLFAAGGYWRMQPDQIERFRVAVDDDRRGKDLQARLAVLTDAGLTVAGDRLKTRPRGVDPNHPRLELLRHRSLHAWRQWEPDAELHEPSCADRVAETWRELRPLTQWLDDHVGPADIQR
jgi:uncharacterized protein (TIGR02453 family)